MRLLYHTALNPSSRKIRVIMHEKKLDFRLMEEDFWERRNEYFAINPTGEVPTLVEGNGNVICGNYSICEYLEESYLDVQFLGNNVLERAEVRRICDWVDNKFEKEVTENILFEKVYKRLMGYGEPSSEAIRAGRKNLYYHIEYLEYLLSNRSWLAGNYLTFADISAAAHISCLDYLGDMPWDKSDVVKEWYALIKSRPSFRSILEDRVTGFRPPTYYMDPDF